MACRQFDSITIQAEYLNMEVLALVWKLNNKIDEYYNNEISKKII